MIDLVMMMFWLVFLVGVVCGVVVVDVFCVKFVVVDRMSVNGVVVVSSSVLDVKFEILVMFSVFFVEILNGYFGGLYRKLVFFFVVVL